MNEHQEFETVGEAQLTEWFGCAPIKEGDGRYRYETSDSANVRLIFSFDAIEA